VPSSAAIDTRERSGKLRGILWRQILTGKEKVAVNILAGNKKNSKGLVIGPAVGVRNVN
jgi:hypothetical protein